MNTNINNLKNYLRTHDKLLFFYFQYFQRQTKQNYEWVEESDSI